MPHLGSAKINHGEGKCHLEWHTEYASRSQESRYRDTGVLGLLPGLLPFLLDHDTVSV